MEQTVPRIRDSLARTRKPGQARYADAVMAALSHVAKVLRRSKNRFEAPMARRHDSWRDQGLSGWHGRPLFPWSEPETARLPIVPPRSAHLGTDMSPHGPSVRRRAKGITKSK